MELDPRLLMTGATFVGSIGVAYGAAKSAIKETSLDVTLMRHDLNHHEEEDEKLQRNTIDRLARLETKIDILLSK